MVVLIGLMIQQSIRGFLVLYTEVAQVVLQHPYRVQAMGNVQTFTAIVMFRVLMVTEHLHLMLPLHGAALLTVGTAMPQQWLQEAIQNIPPLLIYMLALYATHLKQQ